MLKGIQEIHVVRESVRVIFYFTIEHRGVFYVMSTTNLREYTRSKQLFFSKESARAILPHQAEHHEHFGEVEMYVRKDPGGQITGACMFKTGEYKHFIFASDVPTDVYLAPSAYLFFRHWKGKRFRRQRKRCAA